jgi:hypothetical protein
MYRHAIASVPILLCLTSGCFFGDRPATRNLSVEQLYEKDGGGPTFDLDTSRLPDGWIETRHLDGETIQLRLAGGHHVKIVIVPAWPTAEDTTRPAQ